MNGSNWIGCIFFCIIFKALNCAYEIELSKENPSFVGHSNQLSKIEQPFHATVTDCDDCTIEIRISHFRDLIQAPKTPKVLVEGFRYFDFGPLNEDFTPPLGESNDFYFGQWYKSEIQSIEFSIQIDNQSYSLLVLVLEYAQAKGSIIEPREIITMPVQQLDYYDWGRFVVGSRTPELYAYFVIVAPSDQTIYSQTFIFDRRSQPTCVIEVFSGGIPQIGDQSALLYTLTPSDSPGHIHWKVPILTFRFSKTDCYAFLVHRTFMTEYDSLSRCDREDKYNVPETWLVMSNGYPEPSYAPISETRCLNSTEPIPKVSVIVEAIMGGRLEVTFENGKQKPAVLNFTSDSKSLKICQKQATKITYNWMPDEQAVKNFVMAKIKANSPNDNVPDCEGRPTEAPREKDDDKKLGTLALIFIVVGSVLFGIVLGICCLCLLCRTVFKPKPKKRVVFPKTGPSIMTIRSDSSLFFDDERSSHAPTINSVNPAGQGVYPNLPRLDSQSSEAGAAEGVNYENMRFQ